MRYIHLHDDKNKIGWTDNVQIESTIRQVYLKFTTGLIRSLPAEIRPEDVAAAEIGTASRRALDGIEINFATGELIGI